MGGVVKPYRFTVMSCSVIMLGMMGWMSTQAAASSWQAQQARVFRQFAEW